MKSGSWSSYRAATPLECLGDPEDEPRPGVEPWEVPDAPGVYEVWIRSGWGRAAGRNRRIKTGLSLNLATAIAADLDARYRDRLNDRYRAEHDAEMAREASIAASVAAYHKAMDAEDARLLAAMQDEPRCEWCGADVPVGVQVCGPCQASAYPDEKPFESDDIPW